MKWFDDWDLFQNYMGWVEVGEGIDEQDWPWVDNCQSSWQYKGVHYTTQALLCVSEILYAPPQKKI